MKKITINKKKRHILLITLLTTTLMLAGCGNQNSETVVNENSSENAAGASVTPTDESNENEEIVTTAELTEESVTEPERATIELSVDEYYVDYPLVLEDGRQVYVKIVPSLGFYPEKEHPAVGTNLVAYTEMKQLITTLSMHADKGVGETSAGVVYEMDSDYSFINYCIEGNVSGFTYEVSEPENWDSGIIAYRVDSDYGSDYVLTDYVLYYPLDDDSVIEVYISGFLGDYYASGEELYEGHEEILNFYHTEENLFVVVDPKTTDIVISN